jgi:hypothetical protein
MRSRGTMRKELSEARKEKVALALILLKDYMSKEPLDVEIFKTIHELAMQLIITRMGMLEPIIKDSLPNVTLKVRTEELKRIGEELAKMHGRTDLRFEVIKGND